jgi:hypothetical protein
MVKNTFLRTAASSSPGGYEQHRQWPHTKRIYVRQRQLEEGHYGNRSRHRRTVIVDDEEVFVVVVVVVVVVCAFKLV